MNRLTHSTASAHEESGDGSESSPASALGDLSPAHRITSSAWEGWWWGNPEDQLD
jgi:hypothetical protein